jgi:hypothetical protein
MSDSRMARERRESLLGGIDGQTESVERAGALPDCERSAESKGADGTGLNPRVTTLSIQGETLCSARPEP